jgi:hypothetical protein
MTERRAHSAHTGELHESRRKQRVSRVPRDGIEPPTRGFSVPDSTIPNPPKPQDKQIQWKPTCDTGVPASSAGRAVARGAAPHEASRPRGHGLTGALLSSALAVLHTHRVLGTEGVWRALGAARLAAKIFPGRMTSARHAYDVSFVTSSVVAMMLGGGVGRPSEGARFLALVSCEEAARLLAPAARVPIPAGTPDDRTR